MRWSGKWRNLGLKRNRLLREFWPVLLFTVLGFLVMGYHPGAEDDGVYLTAVKADLNPHLFPHDAPFFQLQMRNSTFDTGMALFVRHTGTPLGWAELLGQLTSIFLVLWACRSIAGRLFSETAARWAAVAMVATMQTLPVAGTALFVMDQYLHPRNLATALILIGVSRILAGRSWQALPLVALAVLLHPLMGVFGISFCAVLTLTLSEPVRVQLRQLRTRLVAAGATSAAAFLPLGWIFEPPTPTWLEALHSRHWFRVYEWKWYEWVGALAPLALFWLVARVARKRGETNLAPFATAVFIYGVFQQAVAMVLLGPRALIVFSALEPMRYLQLVYVFMALVGGAYLGRYVLQARVGRWAIFLIVSSGGMCLAQRQLFPAGEHIEFPFTPPANAWLQAFDWIKHNTPEDAYFALDPHYLAAPGEDYHSFRALAERSQLADAIKDTAVITKVPELGPEWKRELDAQAGWTHFQLAEFERLKSEFGADWVLIAYPAPVGLVCRWHNATLTVCQIP